MASKLTQFTVVTNRDKYEKILLSIIQEAVGDGRVVLGRQLLQDPDSLQTLTKVDDGTLNYWELFWVNREDSRVGTDGVPTNYRRATFDYRLLGRFGYALGEEAEAKFNLVVDRIMDALAGTVRLGLFDGAATSSTLIVEVASARLEAGEFEGKRVHIAEIDITWTEQVPLNRQDGTPI